jgi:putative phosphoesterase
LAGSDLILHAGDITCLSVLEQLGDIAPVVAVQGDHDRDAGIDLPTSRIINVRGRRIGLAHGRRTRAIEMPAAGMSLARGHAVLLGMHRGLRRHFGPVDLIVHGHLHIPVDTEVRGTRIFSPGAVYIPEERPMSEKSGIKGRAYMRFRAGMDEHDRRSAVGMVHIGPDGLSCHRIVLPRPIT